MKLLSLFLLLISFLDAKTLSRTQVIMSTFVTITTNERDADFITDGFEIIKEVEMSLSSYNPDAKIYQLNKNRHVKLDSLSHEALLLSKKYYLQTDGYFDITVGSITKDLYRFGENEHIASLDELAGANVDFGALRFNEKEAFLEEGVKVDLGGMGKGFGVDKAAEYFRSKNAKSAVIAASGDIRCISLCRIEVQDPLKEDDVLLSFETLEDDMGITTSGNYNRYVASTKNNHLIDPKAKKPQSLFVSITLVSHLLSSDLDAYATAASVMPLKKAYRFLDSLEVGYIVLQSDGKLVVSKNISEFTKNLLIRDTLKKQP
ncbi:MAG: FAD:protein FMN transferase [Sulfurimonas sp.]|uniref:FAD:protein FMN transferase n=1 Tax=Sulfurimonas sp. TaxID=2022749 RepID=UPI0028CDE97D|nr:FAD:protein FMN transferase [Sulfurimonas sp.]MDT8338346.1 FAD:protein FMN transferase [Sulfurimonas sp.]